jgi:hypothetical protein
VALAPALQFAALLETVAADHPSKVADYQGWNDAGQRALLAWLAEVTTERPPTREVELWRMSKGERHVRGVAVYLPTGIDVRLLERDEFIRTGLARDAPAVRAITDRWQHALRTRGWSEQGS